jgi:hypothetical protein
VDLSARHREFPARISGESLIDWYRLQGDTVAKAAVPRRRKNTEAPSPKLQSEEF